MFIKRSLGAHHDRRVDKSARLRRHGQGLGRDAAKLSSSRLLSSLAREGEGASSAPASAVVTLAVGREGRLFAAHEDVLCQAPFFEAVFRSGGGHVGAWARPARAAAAVLLADEEPDVFSAVLEYLYRGDYYPRLLHDRRRDSWDLEDRPTASLAKAKAKTKGKARADGPLGAPGATVVVSSVGAPVLRDTAIYCAADRYGLDELKRLALRKQGLQAGIDVATILRSARYAYAHTPDSDSRLRAHYLALVIRCRRTFARSGTMQAEMEAGGTKLFFDLFVAMCSHLDDVVDASAAARTPRTV